MVTNERPVDVANENIVLTHDVFTTWYEAVEPIRQPGDDVDYSRYDAHVKNKKTDESWLVEVKCRPSGWKAVDATQSGIMFPHEKIAPLLEQAQRLTAGRVLAFFLLADGSLWAAPITDEWRALSPRSPGRKQALSGPNDPRATSLIVDITAAQGLRQVLPPNPACVPSKPAR